MFAYLLISLNEAREEEVLDNYIDMPEVKEGHILFGEWDLILKLKLDNPEDVASFVIEKVRCNPDIGLTSTLIVAK